MELIKIEMELTKQEVDFLAKALMIFFEGSKTSMKDQKSKYIPQGTQNAFLCSGNIYRKLKRSLPNDFPIFPMKVEASNV
jgi:hypothetical protein